MGGITVVTDSLANIPEDMAAGLSIKVIPFHIVLNGRAYLEGRDINAEKLNKRFDLYHVKKVEPPQEHDYLLFYKKLAMQNRHMLLLHGSGSPGNLFATALSVHEKARYEHNAKIACVDIGTVGPAQGLLCILAARAAASGASLHQVQTLLFAAMEQTRLYIHPGAVRGTRKLPGGFLRSVPILTSDDKGDLVPADKLKPKKGRFLLDMVKHVQKDAGDDPVMLAVTAPDQEALNERILPPFEESLNCRMVMADLTCPSMSVELGPEAIQIAYIKCKGMEKYLQPLEQAAA